MDEGGTGFCKAEDGIDGFTPPESIATGDGANGLEDVWMSGQQFIPDTGAADVVVTLFGGEDGWYEEDGHGIMEMSYRLSVIGEKEEESGL